MLAVETGPAGDDAACVAAGVVMAIVVAAVVVGAGVVGAGVVVVVVVVGGMVVSPAVSRMQAASVQQKRQLCPTPNRAWSLHSGALCKASSRHLSSS